MYGRVQLIPTALFRSSGFPVKQKSRKLLSDSNYIRFIFFVVVSCASLNVTTLYEVVKKEMVNKLILYYLEVWLLVASTTLDH